MSHPSPAAVSGGGHASAQSGVTPTSQMNGVVTSSESSRDSAERSSPTAAAAAGAGRGGDVIKSSLAAGPLDAVSHAGVTDTVQLNDLSADAIDQHR